MYYMMYGITFIWYDENALNWVRESSGISDTLYVEFTEPYCAYTKCVDFYVLEQEAHLNADVRSTY